MFEGSEKVVYLYSGLEKLNRASLLMLVATAVVVIGMALAAASVYAIMSAVIPQVSPHITSPMGPGAEEVVREQVRAVLGSLRLPIAAILAVMLVMTAGLVIALIGIFGKLVPAAEDFVRYDPGFSTASTLIKVGLVVGVVLAIVGALTAFIGIGVLLLIVAWVLILIGVIGIAVLCFKINDKLKSTIMVVAGVLFIISIVLSFIPFLSVLAVIAWILVYAETRSLMKIVEKSLPT